MVLEVIDGKAVTHGTLWTSLAVIELGCLRFAVVSASRTRSRLVLSRGTVMTFRTLFNVSLRYANHAVVTLNTVYTVIG